MQEVTGSIPVFSTKKALYFVGSTVLFFLLKPVFGGCIHPTALSTGTKMNMVFGFFHKLP